MKKENENDASNKPKSLLMLITSMLIFGTIGIFRKAIPLPSSLLAFFRGVIGCGFLVIAALVQKRKVKSGIDSKTALKLVLTGVMIGFNWILLFEAYNYTSVSVATLCYYMQPTFVIIAAIFIFKEKLTVRKGICTVAALAGMVLISGVVENGLPKGDELMGILMGLGAAALYAAVVLTNKTINGVDSYLKTIIQLGSAAIVLLPYLIGVDAFTGVAWSMKAVGLLIVVGIIHTGLSYLLYFASMDGLRTQTVAILGYIDPVTALILAALLLGDKMTEYGIAGAVLILGSAIVSEI